MYRYFPGFGQEDLAPDSNNIAHIKFLKACIDLLTNRITRDIGLDIAL